jgi:hypothetical protein
VAILGEPGNVFLGRQRIHSCFAQMVVERATALALHIGYT